MAHQGVTGTHSAICLKCPDQDASKTLFATITNFGDGSYEWQCHRIAAHRGSGQWPGGAPAYNHVVNPGKL